MQAVSGWICFRIATTFPPSDQEYLPAGQRGTPPRFPLRTASAQKQWNEGLSVFDTQAAAIAVARSSRGRIGTIVVQLNIPTNSGLRWEKSGKNPNHYTLYGDLKALNRYLVRDSAVVIDIIEHA